MDQAVLWILERFTFEASLWSVKVEGLLWSSIDVFLVFSVLKIFGLARARAGARPIIFRYLFLWASAVMTPFLFLAKHHGAFWILDCTIISIHLALLASSVLLDGRRALVMLQAIRRLYTRASTAPEER